MSKIISKFIGQVALLFAASTAVAANQVPGKFSFQGRILKPNGIDPVESAGVTFKVQIRSADSTCLLFEENHTVDMTASSGIFSLNIGAGVNTGATALTLHQVFDNSTMKNGQACAYTPASGDARKLRLTFDSGDGAVTLATDQSFMSVPFALSANSLQGLSRDDLLQINATSTQAKLDAVLTYWSQLVDLGNGTSNAFAKASDLPVSAGTLDLSTAGHGVKVPDAPTGASYAVNKTYVDQRLGGLNIDLSTLAAGQMLVWNQGLSKWTSATPNSGTVTSITAGAGLVAGTITTSGTIALATSGAVAGTYSKLTVDTYGRVTAGQALTESDLPPITAAGAISGNAITSGTIGGSTIWNTTGAITTTGNIRSSGVSATNVGATNLRVYDSTGNHSVTLTTPTILAADYALTLPTADGAAGQLMTTDGAGHLVWLTMPTIPTIGTAGTHDVPAVGDAGLTQIVLGSDTRLTNSRAPSGAAAGDLGGTYPNPSVLKIRGTSVSGAAPLLGQMIKYDGAAWAPASLGINDLKSSVAGNLFPAPACTAAQTISWNAVADQFLCQSIQDATAAQKGVVQIGTGLSAAAGVVSLATSGVAAGTYTSVVVDTYGRVTTGANPTTVSGYGITDAVKNLGGVASIQAGTDAAKPAFGTVGRLYVAVDTAKIYRDSGTSWDVVSSVASTNGTVTGVVAGTGLTGGTISASGTLGVDVGTTAGKIVQLDASGALPAVDASKLTGLPTAGYSNMRVYDTSASFTVPANITKVFVQAWGAGGGGAGGAFLLGNGGGGGGGGAYASAFVTVIPGTNMAVTVGLAGTKGATAASGSSGTASMFSTMTVAGGSGGTTSGSAFASGGASIVSATVASIAGGKGGNPIGTIGGDGGLAANGGQSGRGSNSVLRDGIDGLVPGGGGGGGACNGLGGSGGGEGAPGRVILWY